MKRKIELLAPGGDLDSIRAAIVAGADAVYCGLNNFNARNRATNIGFEDLNGILKLAHAHDCQIFLTLNIIIIESEIGALVSLLNKLVNTDIDGVIVQDLGLLYLLQKHFKSLKIHASTQLTTHNAGQIRFLKQLSVTRANLSRELNISEIRELVQVGHENAIESEVFVHGSNCISFSGLCYISSVLEGKSGNRGRCSQPCREQYQTTPAGKDFPLNLKDNSAFNDLAQLYAAGVDSLKIEGRVKKFHYVYTVVNAWRKQLDNFHASRQPVSDDSDLYRVFNRDFSNAFLTGNIDKEMFIDNPRDNSAYYHSGKKGCTSEQGINRIKQELHEAKTEIVTRVRAKIDELKPLKTPIRISVAGASGAPLKVSVSTAERSFAVFSQAQLASGETVDFHHNSRKNRPERLDSASLKQMFEALNAAEFTIEDLAVANLQAELFLPFREFSAIRKSILFQLRGAKAPVEPIAMPRLKKPDRSIVRPRLSVLISSEQQLLLCPETGTDIHFQLPNCFSSDTAEWVRLFSENPELIPWFPAVLIGENYSAAVDILKQVQPKGIVTDNTGIAYEAYENGISWVAGPHLNCVNSFSLLCLKEQFNCSGAFISNEISRDQMKSIVCPEDFELYYSIYHPALLMTSRQCLLYQIEGCDKNMIDKDCLHHCDKSSSLTSLRGASLFVDKTKGCYHRVFNAKNFLNTAILSDLPGMFSSFFIDLTEVKTETEIAGDAARIIEEFAGLLKGNAESKNELETLIYPTTNIQYTKGI